MQEELTGPIFKESTSTKWSWDNVVGIVTRYELEGPEFETR